MAPGLSTSFSLDVNKLPGAYPHQVSRYFSVGSCPVIIPQPALGSSVPSPLHLITCETSGDAIAGAVKKFALPPAAGNHVG